MADAVTNPRKGMEGATEQARRLGYDPRKILIDSITPEGYREPIQEVESGAWARDESGNLLTAKREWADPKDYYSILLGMPSSARGALLGVADAQTDPYVIDKLILIRRRYEQDPTPQLEAEYNGTVDMLTKTQFDEYKTRYAKMYGEEDVHKVGENTP